MDKVKQQLFIVQGCVFYQDSVLLINRNEPEIPELDGNWELPGGKVEFGESPIDAAVREIREETGVIVKENGRLLPHIASLVRSPKSDIKIQPIIFCYVCEPQSIYLEPIEDKKVNDVDWIPVNRINPFILQSFSFEFIKMAYREYNGNQEGNNLEPQSFRAIIKLIKIDPKRNQEKFWNLQVIGNFNSDATFNLSFRWGRINGQKFNDKKIVKGRKSLLELLDLKLGDKYRKGYVIVKLSENFPYIRHLENFSHKNSAQIQLTLF